MGIYTFSGTKFGRFVSACFRSVAVFTLVFLAWMVPHVQAQQNYDILSQNNLLKNEATAQYIEVTETDDDVTISMSVTDANLTKILKELTEEVKVGLSYETDIDVDHLVSMEMENAGFYEVLDSLLKETDLEYKVAPNKNVLVIRPRENQDENSIPEIINGQITDAETGDSLPGVNVLIKGTTDGTSTNQDGNFELEVPSLEDVLVVSFIGYQRQEVEIDGRTEVNIEMQPDITMLEEAVVVGFGTQERVNLSGAVDQVDARQLQSRSISNVSQGLQGMIPNLNIDYLEGSPGSEPRINIRGFTSINGGSPLIIIDGVPSEARELNRLDPQDVESISVLKDASSAAIYGARAAFGVLLVETKRGTQEGINVNFTTRTSWDKPTVLPNKETDPYIYMRLQDKSTSATPWDYISYTADEYEWARQRSDNPNSTPAVREDPNNPGTWDYMGNRDWIGYFLSDYGMSNNNVLNISGGSEKTSYYLSGSYDRQTGVLQVAPDHYDRYGVRSRVDYRPYSWLNISNNTNYTRSNRTMPSQWSWGDNAMQAFYYLEPMAMDKNPDGTWANTSVGNLGAQLTDGGDLSDARNTFQTTFQVTSTLVEDLLTLNADYTYRSELRNYNYDNKRYSIGYGPDDVREEGTTLVYRDRTTYDYHVFNLYSNLNLDFGEHQISSIVGFNQEINERYTVTSSIGDVISSELPSLSLATGDPSISDYYRGWALRGVFGRVNYTLKDRYILEFNGRYDGSTRFPKADRYGFFPSASIAWRIDQEAFMNSFDWVDMFKVRASFGSLGNQNVGTDNDFGYIPTMGTYRPNYIVGENRPLGISSPGLVSPNYSWEKVSTLNFGVDIDLFENRFMAGFDVYSRKTENMLTLGRELPSVLGASEPLENAADLETKGWELSLHYRDIVDVFGSNLSYGVRFTLADSRAWITRFDNPENFLNQYYVDQEIGEIWGLEFDGLFENEQEIENHADQSAIVPWGVLDQVPGWPKFRDLNGDGIIRTGDTVDNPEDLSVIGNSQARYRFGINLELGWKNFDTRAFFQGVGKRDFYPQHYLYWGFYQQPYQGGWEHLHDFYRGEDDPAELMEQHSQAYIEAGLADANTDAKYPVWQAWLTDVNTPGVGQTPNSGYMLDASYIRLKNLTVGYTLSESVSQKLGIDNLRIYVSGENLAEWSELKDFFDPEAVTDDGQGYRYPFQRRYSIGLNINF